MEKIEGLKLPKIEIPEELKRKTNPQAFNEPLVQLLGFNTVIGSENYIVGMIYQNISSELANVVNEVITGHMKLGEKSRERIIVETELVEESTRESIWKVFEVLNRQKVLAGQLNKDVFESIWMFCSTVLTALLKYEDWPNAARFIYHTQNYRSFRATGEVCTGAFYLLLPFLKTEEFLVIALLTFIEVNICYQDESAKFSNRSRASIFVETVAKNLRVLEHLLEDPVKVSKLIHNIRLQSLVTESPGASSRSIEIEEKRKSMVDIRSLNYVFRLYSDQH